MGSLSAECGVESEGRRTEVDLVTDDRARPAVDEFLSGRALMSVALLVESRLGFTYDCAVDGPDEDEETVERETEDHKLDPTGEDG